MGLKAIFTSGVFCLAVSLHAQEPAPVSGVEHPIAPTALQSPVNPPARYSKQWLREQLDPIRKEQSNIRMQLMQRESESLILQRSKRRKRNLTEESGWWKATAGNTAANNWSPYPDRYLDARMIKYPLPKKTLERHRLPSK